MLEKTLSEDHGFTILDQFFRVVPGVVDKVFRAITYSRTKPSLYLLITFLLLLSGTSGAMTTFAERVGVYKKKTSGRSNGIIFIKVNTIVPKTTTDVANTKASILDIKTGGSTIFATTSPTYLLMIVENFIYTAQVKNNDFLMFVCTISIIVVYIIVILVQR